jgi:protein phosphatase
MPFDSALTNFSIAAAGKTDVGCVRTNNEDSFGYDASLGIFVLCDGMGGQAAGEVASELGVRTVLACFRQGLEKDDDPAFDPAEGISQEAHELRGALHAANRSIRDAIAADARRNGMGTTVVATLLRGKNAAIAHAGDSRVYLIRNGAVEQLTNDHSLVMEQVRRGLLTMEEAEHSPIQNIITRALGVAETVEVDLSDNEVVAGDTFLLCSDGLTRHLSDEEILSQILAAPSLEAACDGLIASAKAAGGSDNITCLLVRAG